MTLAFRLRCVLALALAAAGIAPAGAADRAKATGAELRLLSGFVMGAEAQLGLEIALEPGWKTYWRTPGDSGIPPQIDTSGSVNVAAVAVDFPAPVRFGDGNGESVGYTGPVVLPLRVTLADPSRPATLSARILVGVCREICVPADGDLSVSVDPRRTPEPRAVSAIAAAKARLPKPEGPEAPFRIADVTLADGALRVAVEDPGSAGPDLFVEGPEGWALPLAVRTGAEAGRSLWRVPLEGLPKDARPAGAELRLTLSDGRRAVERRWTLR
ncbi:protein-disulfide reductase DsbD domain-containing protein [Prosthecomicrobium sp. N25]|uniref:protein-disulfide reductase DsbD domain-containing protein n=1 Tax=Prosthecomicrobium sp. N25 TaxID=3129254 RepID=UPI003077D00D